jgi:hypothetical protein
MGDPLGQLGGSGGAIRHPASGGDELLTQWSPGGCSVGGQAGDGTDDVG